MRLIVSLIVVVAVAAILSAALFFGLKRWPSSILGETESRAAGKNSSVIRVKAGANLQKIIDGAAPGDRLVLEAGATFTGPITLKPKPPSAGVADPWITITSSAENQLPGPDERVTPAHSRLMPKIVSGGKEAALRTVAGAHHYRFIGIEFVSAEDQPPAGSLILLGSNAQRTLDEVPHHLAFDRCYIHAASEDAAVKRGIALNSAETSIINSHVSGFKLKGQDSQAICGWNGPGPFKIINNYLEGAGETIMFGGSDATIEGLVPSDIELRRNHITKQLSWRGRWTVKNLVELKSARRVMIEGNLVEYSWRDAQGGYAFVISTRNQDGRAPWSVVEQVTLRNNLVRHTASGISTLGRDYNHESNVTNDLRIENNLFEDIDKRTWGDGYGGVFFKNQGSQRVRLIHNTVLQSDHVMILDGAPSEGSEIRDNIWAHNYYGIWGAKTGTGGAAIERYFPGAKFVNNVLAGVRNEKTPYPPNNYYPKSLDEVGFADRSALNFTLSAASKFRRRGTDGRDVGVDLEALRSATSLDFGTQARSK